MPLEPVLRLEYSAPMRSVEDIQAEIEKLSPDEVERLAEWLAEYRARAWDSRIAEDAGPGGPLRRFIDEALSDFKAGKTRRLP
jgi:hypothetical protein